MASGPAPAFSFALMISVCLNRLRRTWTAAGAPSRTHRANRVVAAIEQLAGAPPPGDDLDGDGVRKVPG
jgi:hypothetical protein